MELQSQVSEDQNKFKVVVMCPGLKSTDIKLLFDSKTGILEIKGKSDIEPEKGDPDFSIEGIINIPSKYRSEEKKAVIENGILSITFGLDKYTNYIPIAEPK